MIVSRLARSLIVPGACWIAAAIPGCAGGPTLTRLLADPVQPPPESRAATLVLVDDTAGAVVDLDEAIRLARARSPEIVAASERVAAALALRGQAGALPNPEVSVEWEGFGGDAVEDTDLILAVGLPLDLAGVHRARRKEADAELQATRARYLGVVRGLEARVRMAFHDAVAARERAAAADTALGVTEATAFAIGLQVDAGKAAPVLLLRAETAQRSAQAEARAARARESIVLRRLAALIGMGAGAGLRVHGELREPAAPLSRDALLAEIAGAHPELLESLWATERWARAASAARRERWPRIVPELGLRHRFEIDGTDFRGGVSLELPLLDRRGRAVEAVERERRASVAETAMRRRDLRAEVEVGLLALEEASDRLHAYERSILPGAREALDLVRLGHERGKFDVLELLDAQRVFNETLALGLESRIAADEALTRLESLAGRGLAESPHTEERR